MMGHISVLWAWPWVWIKTPIIHWLSNKLTFLWWYMATRFFSSPAVFFGLVPQSVAEGSEAMHQYTALWWITQRIWGNSCAIKGISKKLDHQLGRLLLVVALLGGYTLFMTLVVQTSIGNNLQVADSKYYSASLRANVLKRLSSKQSGESCRDSYCSTDPLIQLYTAQHFCILGGHLRQIN
jgi:hypothetical protein